ncbi:MAG: hypothetical protein ACR2OH_12390, partial [Microthrixaceae bacterium]
GDGTNFTPEISRIATMPGSAATIRRRKSGQPGTATTLCNTGGSWTRHPLTDAVIHGEDIRVPLGLQREVPADHLRAVLTFGASWRASPVFVPYRRLSGIRFVASDIGWAHGRGKTAQGDAQQLALAMFGRSTAATGLTGEGVEVLAAGYAQR